MTVPAAFPAAFPGGTNVTRLRVYTSPSIDGLAGGTPHLHTASSEAYVVVSGTGALQTINAGGFTETPLAAGSVVWFTPGTVHRAINTGDLNVLVVMSNAGLPEAGDAVMLFPAPILADPAAYAEAARLPATHTSTSTSTNDALSASHPGEGDVSYLHEGDVAAQRRRDLAVEGFLQLKEAIAGGDLSALDALYTSAAALVSGRIDQWRQTWSSTVEAETEATRALLDALQTGDGSPLRTASLHQAVQNEPLQTEPQHNEKLGMCGWLRTYSVTR